MARKAVITTPLAPSEPLNQAPCDHAEWMLEMKGILDQCGPRRQPLT